LAAFAIIAATGVSLYEAQRARHRFAQVRELANHFIFDFEKSIRDVPGTLAARRMVADTARQYLASLAADARRDPNLTAELAESHYRLSRVEINAGQSQAAQQDLQQAVALLRGIRADCCATPSARLLFITALADLARNYLSVRGATGGLTLAQEAAANARRWLVQAPGAREVPQALTAALSTHGVLLEAKGDLTAARAALAESTQWAARAVQAIPADENLLYSQARALEFLAGLCVTQHDGACARDSATGAAQILDALLVRTPDNISWRNMRAMAAMNRSSGLGFLADQDPSLRPQAVEAARGAYEFAKADTLLDPQSREQTDSLFVATQRLAAQLDAFGRKAEAESYAREAGGIIEALLRRDPQNRRSLRGQFINQALLGEMLMNHGQWVPAGTAMAHAERQISEFLSHDPADRVALDIQVSVFTDQALIFRHAGNLTQARRQCQAALEIAAALIRRDPAMEKSLDDLEKLRLLARQLDIPDPSRRGSKP
jgi:hypothetical protein